MDRILDMDQLLRTRLAGDDLHLVRRPQVWSLGKLWR
jgi:hypothetical protein